jgi:hypothetical protein
MLPCGLVRGTGAGKAVPCRCRRDYFSAKLIHSCDFRSPRCEHTFECPCEAVVSTRFAAWTSWWSAGSLSSSERIYLSCPSPLPAGTPKRRIPNTRFCARSDSRSGEAYPRLLQTWGGRSIRVSSRSERASAQLLGLDSSGTRPTVHAFHVHACNIEASTPDRRCSWTLSPVPSPDHAYHVRHCRRWNGAPLSSSSSRTCA